VTTPERDLHEVRDITVIGAGPVGLSAAFWAGMREASARIVESLPEIGGQLTALYPEKWIYDVPGHPRIRARELVARHREQTLEQFDVPVHLDTTAERISREDDLVVLHTARGDLRTRAVVVAGGHGAFEPRRLTDCDMTPWLGRGAHELVADKAQLAGRRVVVVGGGDSAFDWAMHLEPVARSVTLVHRREAFRAHQRTVDAVRESSVEIVTRAEVSALRGDGLLESVDITVDGETTTRPAQAVVAALGFLADLGPLQQWGIDVSKRHVLVNPAMRTSLERVFAAGDITEYPGKVRLIAVGFGEAATAVNNAAVAIDPSAHVFPGHSSEGT
jgi:ferredoxin/flavodoxin---NADP+ reductase